MCVKNPWPLSMIIVFKYSKGTHAREFLIDFCVGVVNTASGDLPSNQASDYSHPMNGLTLR